MNSDETHTAQPFTSSAECIGSKLGFYNVVLYWMNIEEKMTVYNETKIVNHKGHFISQSEFTQPYTLVCQVFYLPVKALSVFFSSLPPKTT